MGDADSARLEFVGTHCPWCHRDFETPPTCFEHVSVEHFENEPGAWGLVGACVTHSRQLTDEGVGDLVGVTFLARYEADESEVGRPGVFMGTLWMTPDAARQIGHHLLDQTTPERLAEVAEAIREGGAGT